MGRPQVKWVFTADEFAHVWRETGLDRYPAPLRIVETAPTADAAALIRAEFDRRMPLRANPELSVALRIAAQPSSRVKVIADPIRALGCVVGTAGVIITQAQTVSVALVKPNALARTIVAALPVTRPGRRPPMSASVEELRGDGPTEIMRDPSHRPVVEPVRKLLAASRSRTGHVGIEYGLTRDHAAVPKFFSWIDVIDDGRYLVRNGQNVDITPIDDATLVGELERGLRVQRETGLRDGPTLAK
ncbi:ESX secretion-associated protein EspG [Antrihabitans sp. YC2-6]|uniref:ESX secretion-associated protein EspG n=1 Tax=Antrihabitans sp. YC2-6 TaxID=2799498 RepID=UPI0018F67EB2|nr:ESX secretion-associated protein EspG [Antrihabitans sp. YC2-6]MBJ8346360.1 ESX secretion-associated protein EspG [Antrihabitans sp. YC2-6]